MDKQMYLGVLGAIVIMTIAGLLYFYTIQNNDKPNTEAIMKDLNTLKNNDLVFAQYINQNSQALTFLNGCMQTKDNNTTIELLCKKVGSQ